MRFEKWQALGNDYIIIERDELPFELTPLRIMNLCSPHTGVFGDGVLLLSKPEDPRLVARLEIFNPNGSRAELSGNGARQAILYLRRRGWVDEDEFSIATDAGEIRPRILSPTTCRVDMGYATTSSRDYPDGGADGLGELWAGGRTWRFQHVSIGNPQCAIYMTDSEQIDVLDLGFIGRAIESHRDFPNRTNVSWYRDSGEGRIFANIFERGVGETLSSGTGAIGAAVAHVLRGGERGPDGAVTVAMDGGKLRVEVGEDLRVHLTGWARPVFAGQLSEEYIEDLHETQGEI
jgi:diaminopimelate epimerase